MNKREADFIELDAVQMFEREPNRRLATTQTSTGGESNVT